MTFEIDGPLGAADRSPRLGEAQFTEAMGSSSLVDRLVRVTGIYGLSYFIGRVLDEHYPAEAFGDGSTVYPAWASEHGGADIDPGVKWVNLLRAALKEIE